MNNEPVAWIGKDELQFGFIDTRVTNEKESWDDIPLYTHPKETITLAELRKTELYRTEQTRSLREFLEPKELTDEEIEEVEKLCKQPLASWAWQVEFARAILRKAQEK